MRIGGFQKLTLIDFPGKVAATVFTQGCDFRCGFCHNPELVLPQLFQEPLSPEMVLLYLSGRKDKLQGVVITGGEPTLQKGLVDFITRIKEMGLAVKLDTNGSHPEVLTTLIGSKLIDYIAMDIKTSLVKYAEVTGVACDTEKIQESINLIINSGIPYQLRTTLIKDYCSEEDLPYIQLLVEKADHYVLQAFTPSEKMIDARLNHQNQYTKTEVEKLKAQYDKKGIS